MDRSKTNEGISAGVYKWGLRRGQSFSVGLHTTVLQAQIYAIKACIMQDIERGYTGRNICILSNSQEAINGLDTISR